MLIGTLVVVVLLLRVFYGSYRFISTWIKRYWSFLITSNGVQIVNAVFEFLRMIFGIPSFMIIENAKYFGSWVELVYYRKWVLYLRDSSFVIVGVILATVPKKQSETPPPIVPELLPPLEDFRFEYLKLPRANPPFIDLTNETLMNFSLYT